MPKALHNLQYEMAARKLDTRYQSLRAECAAIEAHLKTLSNKAEAISADGWRKQLATLRDQLEHVYHDTVRIRAAISSYGASSSIRSRASGTMRAIHQKISSTYEKLKRNEAALDALLKNPNRTESPNDPKLSAMATADGSPAQVDAMQQMDQIGTLLAMVLLLAQWLKRRKA